MKITKTHRLEATLEEVWAMLSDPAAHTTKFSGMGHREVEVLSTEAGPDSFDITIRRLVDLDVPSIAAKFVKPTNTVTSVDHWERRGDDQLGGHYSVDIKGVPAETKGVTSVIAEPDACAYTVELEVKVKVPMIGEKIAGALRGQLEEQMEAEFAACDAWLAGH